jgi:hypothetical protein
MATWEQLAKYHGHMNAEHDLFVRIPDVDAAYKAHGKTGDILRGRDLLYTYNKFPWHLAPGILHKIIWSKRPLEVREIESLVPADAIWFKNAPTHQSRPDIWHCHVFVKQ